MFDQYFEKFDLAPEVTAALKKCKCIAYAETKEELEEMAYGPTHTSPLWTWSTPVEGKGTVKEAEVVRCKNGCVVNFMKTTCAAATRTAWPSATICPPTSRDLRTALATSFVPPSGDARLALHAAGHHAAVFRRSAWPRLSEPDDLPAQCRILRAVAGEHAGLYEHCRCA